MVCVKLSLVWKYLSCTQFRNRVRKKSSQFIKYNLCCLIVLVISYLINKSLQQIFHFMFALEGIASHTFWGDASFSPLRASGEQKGAPMWGKTLVIDLRLEIIKVISTRLYIRVIQHRYSGHQHHHVWT